MPTSSEVVGISIFDRIRVGGGYVFYSKNNFYFDISYDLLLHSNKNGWRKGRLSIGVSTVTDIKFPITSFHNNLLQRFINWINTPIQNGYRESMYLSKLN